MSDKRPHRPLLPAAPILLVDDEEQALKSYLLNLKFNGYTNIVCLQDSRQAREMLASRSFSLLVLDLSMPHVSGENILAMRGELGLTTPAIVITGHNEVETAVRCMRLGVLDYLVKPVDRTRLLTAVRAALAEGGAMAPSPPSPGDQADAFAAIISRGEAMREVCRQAAAAARSPEPVLVTGETGVGKELLARAIHAASGRTGPFVAVNVAGLDDAMFADTLFGHRKGAFTGAGAGRNGLIEEAAGGTLFLDEMGDLSHASQLKLLRCIQEKEYYPLGSDTPRRMDCRLVAATNLGLRDLMDERRFRRDLFFRLRTHALEAPPLRQRPEDVAPLLEHFLRQAARDMQRPCPVLAPEVVPLLEGYAFPGNVRELKAMVCNALAMHEEGRLGPQAFRRWMVSLDVPSPMPGDDAPVAPVATLKETEERTIQAALRHANGNQSQAARLLGISRQALNKRLRNAG